MNVQMCRPDIGETNDLKMVRDSYAQRGQRFVPPRHEPGIMYRVVSGVPMIKIDKNVGFTRFPVREPR